jgi:hypothetical protein
MVWLLEGTFYMCLARAPLSFHTSIVYKALVTSALIPRQARHGMSDVPELLLAYVACCLHLTRTFAVMPNIKFSSEIVNFLLELFETCSAASLPPSHHHCRNRNSGAGWTAARNAPGSFALFGGAAFTKEYVFKLDHYGNATWGMDFCASIVGAMSR